MVQNLDIYWEYIVFKVKHEKKKLKYLKFIKKNVQIKKIEN